MRSPTPSLRLSASNGDGLDGFAVERVFDDAHRFYTASGVSVWPAAGAFM